MPSIKQSLVIIPLLAVSLGSAAAPPSMGGKGPRGNSGGAYGGGYGNKNTIGITAYLGERYSENIRDKDTQTKAYISNDFSQALAISWSQNNRVEAELFYSISNHNLTITDIDTDLYISYLHLGGKTNLINRGPFSTSIGAGIGATFFNPDESQYDSETDFSGNINLGARFQLSPNLALKADLRLYGTVINSHSALLCHHNQCVIDIDGDLYVQTSLMAGIEFKF